MPKIFIDTNILIFTIDRNDNKKLSRARKLLENIIANDMPVISTQVLQEFYSATTTKLIVEIRDPVETERTVLND